MGRLQDVLIDPFEEDLSEEKLEKLSTKIKAESGSGKKEKVTTKEKASEKIEKVKTGDEKKILEAALFMASEPMSLEELGKIVGIGSVGYLKKYLDELIEDYQNRGVEIVEKNGGWLMQVKAEYSSKVSNLTPYADLSDGCKRTLALVVYKEPVKQAEIIKLQGNKAYAYIKALEKRGLIKSEKIGRNKILKLTKEFENYFGEEIEQVKERVRKAIAKEQADRESVLVK